MSTLYDIYKQQGKALPSTVEARFADPQFAAAAQQAGITQDQYRINAGNADMNTRIASLYGKQPVQKSPLIQTTSSTRAMDTANIQRLDTELQRKSAMPVQQFANINGFQVPIGGNAPTTAGDNQMQQQAQQQAQQQVQQPTSTQTTTSTQATSTRTPEQEKTMSAANDFKAILEEQTRMVTQRYEETKARASAENQLLIDTVKSKFDRLRNKMLDSNSRLLSQIEKNNYTSESFRYTPVQAAGTLFQAEQEGIDRLRALDEEENIALLKAAQAKSQQEHDALANYLGQIDKINQQRLNVLKEQSDIALQIDKSISESKTVTSDGSIMPKSTKDQIDVAKNLAPFLLSQVSGLDITAQENFFKSQADKFGVPQELLKSATEEYRTERLDKTKTTKTLGGGATKLTAAEKKANVFSGINQIIDGQLVDNKTGVPYVDGNGFFTPVGFKAVLKAALADGISKKEVLQEYGQYLYLPEFENYGLTPADRRAIDPEA